MLCAKVLHTQKAQQLSELQVIMRLIKNIHIYALCSGENVFLILGIYIKTVRISMNPQLDLDTVANRGVGRG